MGSPSSIDHPELRVAGERLGTRDRILNAAATLFSRHGYSATGIKAILAEADAPYGSLYHFFPGGKQELGVAVVEFGGDIYRQLVEAFYVPGGDVVAATASFFDGAADLVESSGYVEGCPLATIALEIASSDEPMRAASAAAFESWLVVLRERLIEAGIAADRSAELAVVLFCAIEGAFLLSRTTRRAEPVRIAGRAAVASVRRALGA